MFLCNIKGSNKNSVDRMHLLYVSVNTVVAVVSAVLAVCFKISFTFRAGSTGKVIL